MATILQGKGSFEILSYTPNLLQLIELAGRTCYKSEDRITDDSACKFCKMLLGRGHESVIEHGYMTVRFTNLSRGFTHELVRHRLASYSQESTRYVDESDLVVVLPPHRDKNTELTLSLQGTLIRLTVEEWFDLNQQMYSGLLSLDWPPEDARQTLPIGTTSDIVMSCNIREWRHVFTMRTSKPAHWEIRAVMCNLLLECKRLWPILFFDFHLAGEDKNGVPYYEKVK